MLPYTVQPLQRACKTSQPEHCESEFHGSEGFVLIASGVEEAIAARLQKKSKPSRAKNGSRPRKSGGSGKANQQKARGEKAGGAGSASAKNKRGGGGGGR